MSFLKLSGAIVIGGASLVILVADYTDTGGFEKVGLICAIVANLAILVEHYGQYRKRKLFKAEVEKNVARITSWLIDNRTEFEQNGISERSLARATKLSTPDALATAIDWLESREAVVRDAVALTDSPNFLVRPGRNWTSTRDKLLESLRATEIAGLSSNTNPSFR